MFEVVDKLGRKQTVYSVRIVDEHTEFLMWYGQWEWWDAVNFQPF